MEDNKGNTYYFDTVEEVESYSFNYRSSNRHYHNDLYYNISWYLSKVETACKQTIKFSYDSEKYFTNTDSELLDKKIYPHPISENDTWYLPRTNFHYDKGKKRLRKISTHSEIIEFVPQINYREDIELYSNANHDYNKLYAIDKIEILKTGTYQKIKSYQLNYSYFNKEEAQNTQKRLKLESLYEYGKGYYKFYYDERYSIPELWAKGQDIWGFYNGAANEKLIPTIYRYPSLPLNERVSYFDLGASFDSHRVIYPGANRTPNPEYITLRMLNKLEYPTGGVVKYEYESNQFTYMNKTWNGGGVRIKSIKKFNSLDETKPAKEQFYSYSTGKLISLPFVVRPWLLCETCLYISATPANNLGISKGGFVIYPQVSISEKEKSSMKGKTTYTYSTPAAYDELSDMEKGGIYSASKVYYHSYHHPKKDFSDFEGENRYPFPPNPNYDFCRGLLLNEMVFDSKGELLKTTKYEYDFYYPKGRNKHHPVYSIKTHSEPYFDKVGLSNPITIYFFSKYETLTDVTKVLVKKTEHIYEGSSVSIMDLETSFFYSIYHLNPIMEKSNGKSKNEYIIQKYKYTQDYSRVDEDMDGLGALYNSNINIQVEKSLFIQKDNQEYLLNAEINHYSGWIYPHSKWMLNPASLITDFKPSEAQANQLNELNFDKRYTREIRYLNYDINGNPVCVHDVKKGTNTVYLWSYNGQYLVAKIENSTYNDVKYALGGEPIINQISKNRTLSKDYQRKINRLRNDTILKDALITTYIYDLKVGMTSMTDPTDVTTHYRYDEFGRLKDVYIDNNGQEDLIESYEYHYKGE